jgi:2-polyprenyl-6-methoxyphenol hydroxylase-like FAD-dependent oxidoreductase
MCEDAMTTVAIIGAGQTGASAALALAKRGVEVTLYSDRSQESLRQDVPATGTAVLFGDALQAERDLGLRSYRDVAPVTYGMSHRVVGEGGIELIGFDGAFDGFIAEGIDARLKADDRITEFRSLGGKFVVGAVDADGLDAIAAAHDLTLVATGKGGLSSLFPRDESRSFFSGPQRHVLMLTVKGLGFDDSVFAHRSRAGGRHAAFSFNAENGEAWWGPYYHKDAGPAWSFLSWARPGSAWERRLAAATSAESALRIVVDLHREFLPWDLPEVLQLELIPEDPHAWLKGAVAPEVRSGVGHTRSGRAVASLGDTSIAYDPLAGQGAQSGLIQTALYVDRILTHDGPFDERWIRDAFETFYLQRGAAGELVTRLFLGHPGTDAIAQILISAANGSERFAGQLFGFISHPQPLLGIRSVEDAKALVTQFAGEDAEAVLARSAALIESAQKAHAARLPYFARAHSAAAYA